MLRAGLLLLAVLPIVARADMMPPPRRETIARAATEELGKGDFAAVARRFGPELAAKLSAERLGQGWKAGTAEIGPFEGVTYVASGKYGDDEIVVARARLRGGSLAVRYRFGAGDLISGIHTGKPFVTGPYEAPAYVDRGKFEERDVMVGRGAGAL